jgi:hypothetical protein
MTILIIAVVAIAALAALLYGRLPKHEVRTKGRIIGSLVAAVVLLAAGLLLLGLPGAFILGVVNGLFGGPSGFAAFKGDRAWPAAIFVTILMPIGVILSAVALAIISPDAKAGRSFLWGLLGYILAGVVAVTMFIIIL